MFDFISGVVERKTENYAVVEVGGIGYRISTSLFSLQSVHTGEKVRFHTYVHIREDALELYGFTSATERSTFEMLISVSGVGPKAALNILSVAAPEDLILAIVTNDAKAITKAQGVGPKLAQRIILELKDKIKGKDLMIKGNDFSSPVLSHQNEAVEALVSLGYSASEAALAVKGLDDGLTVEETIKASLKQLGTRS